MINIRKGRYVVAIIFFIIKNEPSQGISPHFHIAEIRRGQIKLGTNNHISFGEKGQEIKFQMSAVVTSWLEFTGMMKKKKVYP